MCICRIFVLYEKMKVGVVVVLLRNVVYSIPDPENSGLLLYCHTRSFSYIYRYNWRI